MSSELFVFVLIGIWWEQYFRSNWNHLINKDMVEYKFWQNFALLFYYCPWQSQYMPYVLQEYFVSANIVFLFLNNSHSSFYSWFVYVRKFCCWTSILFISWMHFYLESLRACFLLYWTSINHGRDLKLTLNYWISCRCRS